MITFAYRCPHTGQQVHGHVADVWTCGLYRLWRHSSRQSQDGEASRGSQDRL